MRRRSWCGAVASQVAASPPPSARPPAVGLAFAAPSADYLVANLGETPAPTLPNGPHRDPSELSGPWPETWPGRHAPAPTRTGVPRRAEAGSARGARAPFLPIWPRSSRSYSHKLLVAAASPRSYCTGGGISRPCFGAVAITFSTSGGPPGEEDESPASSPTSSWNLSNPAGARSARNLAGRLSRPYVHSPSSTAGTENPGSIRPKSLPSKANGSLRRAWK